MNDFGWFHTRYVFLCLSEFKFRFHFMTYFNIGPFGKMIENLLLETTNYMNDYWINPGLTKPGEVGDFFTLVSMKSPNFCQKAKF